MDQQTDKRAADLGDDAMRTPGRGGVVTVDWGVQSPDGSPARSHSSAYADYFYRDNIVRTGFLCERHN